MSAPCMPESFDPRDDIRLGSSITLVVKATVTMTTADSLVADDKYVIAKDDYGRELFVYFSDIKSVDGRPVPPDFRVDL